MKDLPSFVGALIFGSAGVALLARLDIPYILRGGAYAAGGVVDLLVAITVVSVSVGLGAGARRDPPS